MIAALLLLVEPRERRDARARRNTPVRPSRSLSVRSLTATERPNAAISLGTSQDVPGSLTREVSDASCAAEPQVATPRPLPLHI
jgi:hypothetical protein